MSQQVTVMKQQEKQTSSAEKLPIETFLMNDALKWVLHCQCTQDKSSLSKFLMQQKNKKTFFQTKPHFNNAAASRRQHDVFKS